MLRCEKFLFSAHIDYREIFAWNVQNLRKIVGVNRGVGNNPIGALK